MNKYLTKRNELAKELEKEFNKRDYEIFTEMEIANELDNLIDNDCLEFNFDLTDEQQEEVIEIIYDFYMECESDVSVYSVVKAVLKTMSFSFKMFWTLGLLAIMSVKKTYRKAPKLFVEGIKDGMRYTKSAEYKSIPPYLMK